MNRINYFLIFIVLIGSCNENSSNNLDSESTEIEQFKKENYVNKELQKDDLEKNVSMENFPEELVGEWCDDCEARNLSIQNNLHGDYTYFTIDKKGKLNGGFQYETSATITSISGSNGVFRVRYSETEFGGTTAIKNKIVKITDKSLEIDGKRFYQCFEKSNKVSESNSRQCGVCGRSFSVNGYEEQMDGSWVNLEDPYENSICSPSCGRRHNAEMNRIMNENGVGY